MLEDLGEDDEGHDDPVALPNVNAAILKKRSLNGAPTIRTTLLLLKMMRTKKSEQMLNLFGTKNS
jgi:hypothetical protein